MYISGLLTCFRCHLDFPDQATRIDFFRKDNALAVAAFVSTLLDKTPLDLLAETLTKYVNKPDSIRSMFTAYDAFLGILSDGEKRRHLELLTPEELDDDPVYKDARDISHQFGDSVKEIFLTPDNEVGKLTIRYGVF
jgi:hypothetical protein